MGNVAIYIDAEYLLQSLRGLKNKPQGATISKTDIDWIKLIECIADGREVSKVNYYTARLDKNENKEKYDEQTAFLENVKKALAPYNVQMRTGKMVKQRIKSKSTWYKEIKSRKREEGTFSWTQKGIDTKIVLDMCDYSYNSNPDTVNYAVLISGDADFAETLNYLNKRNIKTEVIAFDRQGSGISKDLKAAANSSRILDYKYLTKNAIIRQ